MNERDEDKGGLARLESVMREGFRRLADGQDATNAALAETNAALAETNAALAETNAALAETNAALAETNATLAETQIELRVTREELGREIGETRTQLREEIAETRTQLREEIAETRKELGARLDLHSEVLKELLLESRRTNERIDHVLMGPHREEHREVRRDQSELERRVRRLEEHVGLAEPAG